MLHLVLKGILIYLPNGYLISSCFIVYFIYTGQIRLSLISVPNLLNVVRPTSLVSSEAILDAIAANTLNSSSKLNHRGLLLVDENVATSKFGAEVLIGEMKNYLLDGDTDNYDMERG